MFWPEYLSVLEHEFGRYGVRLHELARGIDENPVVPDRPTQSIWVEDTFEQDVLLAETEPMIRRLAEKLWSALRNELRIARTVVLETDQARSRRKLALIPTGGKHPTFLS